eukprot:3835828-Amphidinium_carterae.1
MASKQVHVRVVPQYRKLQTLTLVVSRFLRFDIIIIIYSDVSNSTSLKGKARDRFCYDSNMRALQELVLHDSTTHPPFGSAPCDAPLESFSS